MKVPAPPPPFDDLLRATSDAGRLGEVFGRRLETAGDDYRPWDDLRYRKPPDGLTLEEWWVAIRLARHAVERPIARLKDVHGTPFKFNLPDAVLQEVDYINRNASGSIQVSEQVTNPATRDRYVVNSLIEEAITSSQLEGAVTTRRVAKQMIREGRSANNRSELMILNNYRAMRHIVELRNSPLTPELICDLQRIVTEGTLDKPEAAGQLQASDEDRIAVWGDGDQLLHKPPSALQLPKRLQALCDFANDDRPKPYMPPVLRAITLHFMLGYDHYFEDGNGRTARAVFYWSMLRQGFWLTEFLTISRILKQAPAQYARSFLYTEQDEGDLTYFFLYHLKVLHRAIDDLHDYLAVKAAEIRDLQQTIAAIPGGFNHRQLALLEHAVKHPGASYTAVTHSSSHGTSQETARHDLLDLERRGLLVRSKLGKRFVWAPVDDMIDHLRT